MAEKAKAPAIRFKGFTDDWEQRKFGEVVIPYADPVATPSDGYFRLGIRSHAKGTFHTYVRPGMELKTAKMHRVGKNNFIVNITFGWEHAVAITDENDAGKLVSHRFPQFSFIEGMVPRCFKFAILDEKFRHHLWISSPGGAGRNRVLKINEMLEYPFWVTSEDEQKKIADFLLNLENLITLHQRKLLKLKNIKKAMLEKMFPRNSSNVPEIRFAGFTDAWEQRKLGELCDVYDGTHQTPNYQSSGIMFLSVENINSLKSEKYISEEDFIKNFNVFPEKGDVLMTRIGDIGTANVVVSNEPKAYYVSLALLKKKSLDPYFLKESISSETVKNDLWKRTLHTAFPKKINKNEIAEVFIPHPKKREEQEQIGMFFKKLNNLITLHQSKHEKLQNVKKACLEKMFV